MNLDKFLGCIFGVAIGDELGVPFERMDACEIKNRVGNVRTFHPPCLTSDDTIATRATLRGITMAYAHGAVPFGLVMDAIAEYHKEAFSQELDRGWGRSHRVACENLLNGKHWSQSGNPNGAGNGVMMKISPYALLRSVVTESPRIFTEECITFARMTHLGTPAIVAGVVHAFAVASLAGHKRPYVHIPTFLYFLHKVAIEVEEGLERNLPTKERWKDKISDQIRNIMEYIEYGREGRLGTQDPESMAKLFFGGTSYAPASFGLSYAIFAKSCLNPDNPEPFRAVYEAIEAGGDTDTNASIVGALVGALHGFKKAIPVELARDVEGSGELRKLTAKFYYTCEQRRRL